MIRPTALAGLLAVLQGPALAHAQAPRTLDRYQIDIGDLQTPVDAVWLTDDRLVVLESDPPAIRIADWRTDSSPIAIDCGEPAGLATGPDGTLLITDSARNRILQLHPDGTTLRSFGVDDALRTPTGIIMHEDRIFVADTGNDRIVVLDLDGTVVDSFGSRGEAAGLFRRPQGLDIDSENRLVVADTDNHRIQILTRDGKPITQWGSWGSFPGLFQEPSDIHCIEDRVLVSDRLNHRIQEFRSDGTLLNAWGMHSVKPREGRGRIHYPDALTITPDGTRLAVVESFEDRVQFFGAEYPDWIDEDTRQRMESRPTSAPRGGIQSHFGPTVDLDDRILVVWEPEARAVLIFDHQRATPIRLTSIFSRGDGPGGFGHLADLHWDHHTNQLHLFDRGTSQVHVYALDLPPADEPRFDPSMARLLTSRTLDASIPMHRIVDAERAQNGRWYLLDGSEGSIHVLDAQLQPVDRWVDVGLQEPVAIAHDSRRGDLLVLDRGSRGIHRLDESGRTASVTTIQSPRVLVRPNGMAVTRSGDLLISDGGGHGVHRFTEDGTHLASWGSKGSDHEEFWKPAGIVVDDRDRVIVLDHGNHRCQMFDLEGRWIMTFGAGRAYTPSNRPPQRTEDE